MCACVSLSGHGVPRIAGAAFFELVEHCVRVRLLKYFVENGMLGTTTSGFIVRIRVILLPSSLHDEISLSRGL